MVYDIYRRVLKITNKILLKSFLNRKEINCGSNFVFNLLRSTFEITGPSTVIIGNNVTFRDFCNVLCEDSKLNLGNSVFFNRYCSINCLEEIIVGDYSIFGEGVKLYDHNHVYEDNTKIIQHVKCKSGKIKVGKNCWIGANVTILNNVTIGDNVVIGANNLIFKDIPSNVVVKNKVDKIINQR